MTRRSKRKESEPGADGAAAADAATLFVEKCKADESAQLQVVSAAVDLTAALDQLDETE